MARKANPVQRAAQGARRPAGKFLIPLIAFCLGDFIVRFVYGVVSQLHLLAHAGGGAGFKKRSDGFIDLPHPGLLPTEKGKHSLRFKKTRGWFRAKYLWNQG
jgi:hypothetical protein